MVSMMRPLADNRNTVAVRSQMPVLASDVAPAALAASVAASAGVIEPDADDALLAEGTEAAIASMCAFNAFAPKPSVSLSLENCAMLESRLRLALSRSSSPC